MFNKLKNIMKNAAGSTQGKETQANVDRKLSHESGLLVKNGEVLRIRGTAYEPDTEKPFGAWGQVTIDGTEFFSSFSLKDYHGKIESAPYIALTQAIIESKIGDIDALQKLCKLYMSKDRR